MLAVLNQKTSNSLVASVVPFGGDPSGLACLICQSALDLLQPDPDNPDHLLGTCPSCGAWHAIAVLPGGTRAAIAPLDIAEMARALGHPATPNRADVA